MMIVLNRRPPNGPGKLPLRDSRARPGPAQGSPAAHSLKGFQRWVGGSSEAPPSPRSRPARRAGRTVRATGRPDRGPRKRRGARAAPRGPRGRPEVLRDVLRRCRDGPCRSRTPGRSPSGPRSGPPPEGTRSVESFVTGWKRVSRMLTVRVFRDDGSSSSTRGRRSAWNCRDRGTGCRASGPDRGWAGDPGPPRGSHRGHGRPRR